MTRRYALLVLLSPAVLGCGVPTAPSAIGSWGGSQASLTLTRAGGAVGYACGEGTIDSGWTMTREGVLAGTGAHYFGGGPVPPQGHPAHPATYSGHLAGDRLTLTVTVTDLGLTLGPFDLVRDGPTVTDQCL
jgi:hypothetical protein